MKTKAQYDDQLIEHDLMTNIHTTFIQNIHSTKLFKIFFSPLLTLSTVFRKKQVGQEKTVKARC